MNHQSKLSRFSNSIFVILCTFVISFIWINFYLRNAKISLITTLIITIATFIVFFTFQNIKNKLRKIKKSNIQSQEHLIAQLLYGSDNNSIKQIISAFDLKDIIKISSNHYVSNQDQTDIFFMFHKETLDNSDIIYAYKSKKLENIKIFCINYNINLKQIEKCILQLIDINDLSKQFKESNILLDNKISIPSKNKLKTKDIFKGILNKTKSKQYFGFGLLIMFTSFFSPYYLYYNIIGSILILTSIYCRFNKKFN